MKVILIIIAILTLGYFGWVFLTYDTDNPYGKSEISEEEISRIRGDDDYQPEELDPQEIMDKAMTVDQGDLPISRSSAEELARNLFREYSNKHALDDSKYVFKEPQKGKDFMWIIPIVESSGNESEYWFLLDRYGRASISPKSPF